MEANRTSTTSGKHGVLDCATVFLCRQGQTWVVVLESPSVTAAQLLRGAALQRMLSGKPGQRRHRRRLAKRQEARRCRAGSLHSLAGRPLAFDLLGRRPAGC